MALFTGKDSFLRALYTQELRDIMTRAHGEVDQINFDGESCSAADVLDDLLRAVHESVSEVLAAEPAGTRV